jgi:DNA-binding response OmpR family regulator
MSNFDGRCVCVVDDDPDILETLKYVLEDSGYAVVTASNGAEALSKLHDAQVSLILLDLMMPGMSGFEFRNIQVGDASTASIPVVVLSGDGAVDKKAASLGLPALRKPVDLDTLLSTVEQFCAGECHERAPTG